MTHRAFYYRAGGGGIYENETYEGWYLKKLESWILSIEIIILYCYLIIITSIFNIGNFYIQKKQQPYYAFIICSFYMFETIRSS